MKTLFLVLSNILLFLSISINGQSIVDENTKLDTDLDSISSYIGNAKISYELKLEFAKEVLTNSIKLKDKEAECYILFAIAGIYLEEVRSIDSAAIYINKGRSILLQVNSPRLVYKYNLLIASLNRRISNISLSKKHLLKNLKLSETLDKEDYNPGVLYNELAYVYFAENKIDSSLYFLNMAIKYANENNDDNIASISYCNIAAIYIIKEKDSLGIDYYRKAEAIALEKGDSKTLSYVYVNFAKYYISNNELEKAKGYLDIAEDISKKEQYYELLNNITLFNSMILEKTNNYKEALELYKTYVSINDSISNELRNNNFNDLHTYYQTSLKEMELDEKRHLLTIENQKRKLREIFNYILVFVTIMLIIVSYLIIMRYKKNKEVNFMKMQLIKNELDNNKKDLAAFAMDISRRNKFATDIYELVCRALSKRDVETKLEEFKNIKKEVKKQLDVNESLKELQLNSEVINNAFFHKLEINYPNITKGEKQLCGFIKINLSSKDILFILNISPETLKSKRYRLKKKLSLAANDNLDDFIRSF
jgi:hypothetical protein